VANLQYALTQLQPSTVHKYGLESLADGQVQPKFSIQFGDDKNLHLQLSVTKAPWPMSTDNLTGSTKIET